MHFFPPLILHMDHFKFWKERKKEPTKKNPPNTKKPKSLFQ